MRFFWGKGVTSKIAILSLGFILLGLTAATGQSSMPTSDAAPMCWAPSALLVKDREQQIQKGIVQAFVPLPSGQLAEFSP
jgi:hypothetical protein